jgi:methionyl-tRNA formyltransferase
MAPCPLKAHALDLDLPVLSPEKVGEASVVESLREAKPDLIALVAFGQYIPQRILEMPQNGAINLHPSLLPAYRGAAPIQRAIADGCKETGVTIMYMSEEMDAGDIILQQAELIHPKDTGETLSERLGVIGAELMWEAVNLIREDRVERVPQEHEKATYAAKLTKEEGRIDWSLPATVIRNRVRAFQPWPICYCEIPAGSGSRLRVYECTVEQGSGKAGEILDADGPGPLVAAGEGAVRLIRVQPAGKKVMDGEAYLCGHAVKKGQSAG